MWGNGWGSWIFGFLMMGIFWGVLGLLVFLALRGRDSDRSPGGRAPNQPDARAILEERFARGEISKEEFEERRRVLEHGAR